MHACNVQVMLCAHVPCACADDARTRHEKQDGRKDEVSEAGPRAQAHHRGTRNWRPRCHDEVCPCSQHCTSSLCYPTCVLPVSVPNFLTSMHPNPVPVPSIPIAHMFLLKDAHAKAADWCVTQGMAQQAQDARTGCK
jgi:hypothetical protein